MTRTKAAQRVTAALLASFLALALSGCSDQLNTVKGVAQSVGGALGGVADAAGGVVDKALGGSIPTIEEALRQQRSAKSATVSTPTIHTDGVLTVGLGTAESAPMLVSSDNGSYQGYDVDVAYAIADELGLSVKFVSVTDAASAESAGADIVMGAKSDSAGGLTVVGSYAESATAFFHKGAETTVSHGDLVGKKVGVQENSLSQQLVKRSDLNMTTQTFSTINDAFAALDAGSIDYVLCDALSGAYLQCTYGDISLAGTIDVPTSTGVGVASTNTDLQNYVKQAIDTISSNGVSGVIRGKWLGGMSELTSASQIQGITISSATPTTSEGGTGNAATTIGGTGAQDGSTAGANAVDIAG